MHAYVFQTHVFAFLALLLSGLTLADEAAVRRGYEFLLNTPLVPPDFPQEIFDDVWQVWPEPLRSQAEEATPEERRKLAFARYGLTPRPEDPTKPLQYVVGKDGQWTMNCFACHGGQVAGKAIAGLPNSNYALSTLVEETRASSWSGSRRWGGWTWVPRSCRLAPPTAAPTR